MKNRIGFLIISSALLFLSACISKGQIMDGDDMVRKYVEISQEKAMEMMQQDDGLADSFAVVGQKVEKKGFLQMSKNRAEFRIENKDTERLPEIIQLFLTLWKQRMMMLNNEENRILAEFRDALLPELMSGRLEVK